MTKNIFTIIFIVLAFGLFSINAYAQKVGAVIEAITGSSSVEDMFERADRMQLKGIKDVYIVIESLDPIARNLGITEDQIRTDVEIKLRNAGINVKTKGTFVMFYVNVGITKSINGLYGVSEAVEVKDMVYLLRDPKIMFQAEIWGKRMFGIGGEYTVSNSIRQTVRDLTDKFILDYLKAKQD